MTNKKFNFVLLGFNPETITLAPLLHSYALDDFGCDGIEEFSLEEARVDEILGERAYSGGDVPESLIDEVQAATEAQESCTYKYFFYQGDFEHNSAAFEMFIKDNYPQVSTYAAQKDFEDWNAEWKKFYNPIHISENLEIVPEWMKNSYVNKSKQQVYIYPGMGFGTGTHETTYLCMVLYDKIMNKFNRNSTCLDFGCGSGILGIGAMITKQMKTHFCDIDISALENCTQNLVLNFEGQDLTGTSLVIRDRYQPQQYDLVFANILEHVLIIEKQTITDSLKANGHLIVSGLLNHQVNNIIKEYSHLKMTEVVSKGDWSAILFEGQA